MGESSRLRPHGRPRVSLSFCFVVLSSFCFVVLSSFCLLVFLSFCHMDDQGLVEADGNDEAGLFTKDDKGG